MQTPSRFNAAMFFGTEGSKCCFSSHSLICGATSFCANSRTVCTSALWSSVSSKLIMHVTLFNQVLKMTGHLTQAHKKAQKAEIILAPCFFSAFSAYLCALCVYLFYI